MITKIKDLIKHDKFHEAKNELVNLDIADIAELIQKLKEKDIVKIFSLLPKDLAAHTFSYLDLHHQQIIINSLTDNEAAKIIDEMAADDATDLIHEMPSNIVTKILANTTDKTRKDINNLLHYEAESAGSIMTVEFIEVKGNVTIKEAIKEIREDAVNKESIDYCYILSDKRKLLGTLSLKEILLTDENKYIYDVMKY